MAENMDQDKCAQETSRDLQREIKQVMRGRCEQKTRRAEQRIEMEKLRDNSERQQPSQHGLQDDTSLPSTAAFFVFGFPKLVISSIMRRFTLMVWWTGAWVNQGISIFCVENGWTRLESAKTRLEQDKLSLEEHLLHLQHIIYRKDEELSREKELRMRLLAKLTQDKKRQCEHEATVGQLSRSVMVLNNCVKNLNRELRTLKTMFVKRHEKFERIHEEPLHSSPEPAARARTRQGEHTQCTYFKLDELDADGTENYSQDVIQSRSPRAPDRNNQTVRERLDLEDEQDHANHASKNNCHTEVEKCNETRKRRPTERNSPCRCFKVFLVWCLVFTSVAVLTFCLCPECFYYCWGFFGNHLNNEIPLTSSFMTWVTRFLKYVFLMNSS